MTKHRSRTDRKSTKIITMAHDILSHLEEEQGKIEWAQRADPISELVFTILSQHTSDANAERATIELTRGFPTWEDVALAEPSEVMSRIRTAGLAQQKTPRIQNSLMRIIELRGSLDLSFLKELPLQEAKSWLRNLPGVGPKTAGIVLSFSLGMPAMAVDTHIYRVCRRLGLIDEHLSVEQAHDFLESIVPQERVYQFHVAVISHGRKFCKALRPLCSQCTIRELCPSRRDLITTKQRH